MNCILNDEYNIKTIENLLPHREKMLLVQGITSFKLHKGIKGFFNTAKDSIFFDEKLNGIPSYVGFEHIAQSLCIYKSLEDMMLGINTPENEFPGVLISVSNLICYKASIPCDKTILIEGYKIESPSNMNQGFGKISVDGEDIMECTLSSLVNFSIKQN